MQDISYYNSEKNRTEAQISQANSENQSYEKRIERLETVKTTLEEQKGLFYTVKQYCKNNLEAPSVWLGKNRQDFDSDGDTLKQDNESFYKAIDTALDAICDEITRCENEIYKNNGLLGRLRSYWNSLCNEIEKIYNDFKTP